MFCKHNWELLSETITPTKAERYHKHTGRTLRAGDTYQLQQLTEQKLIQVVTCKKCGKLKKLVEEF